MKNNLLAVLADDDYFDQAKQLLSSVYWNGGWSGEVMVLSRGLTTDRLNWFRERGILVYECRAMEGLRIGCYKFFLFQEEFKRWERVVFLDLDMIVRRSLKGLEEVEGFWAVKDPFSDFVQSIDLTEDFRSQPNAADLLAEYNPEGVSFNSGLMAFSTDIIKKETFGDLVKLDCKYANISRTMDQLILNIYFQNKWQSLPWTYNLLMSALRPYFIYRSLIKQATIIHFCGRLKPWHQENHFYREWSRYFNLAEGISFSPDRPRPLGRTFTLAEKEVDWRKVCQNWKIYCRLFPLYLAFDRQIGKAGLWLRKSPVLKKILKPRENSLHPKRLF